MFSLMYRGLHTGYNYKPPNLINLARTIEHLLCSTSDLNIC